MTTVMTRSVARMLLLPTFVIAFAVIIKGYADIGDGFSAGVIASLGIILQGVAFGPDEFDRLPLVRFAPLAPLVGVALVLGVAFGPVLAGKPILSHWPPAGEEVMHFGTLEFFTPLLFDIGVFLVVVGFCVGSVGAIARAVERVERERIVAELNPVSDTSSEKGVRE
jgi:multicomponent Na+:H+ antiporter subunit B